jgi:hypothetical protein
MDWLPFLFIFGIGAIVITVVLFMLNRAWGDFPGRISALPPPLEAASPRRAGWSPEEDDDLADAAIPDAAPPTEGSIVIQHPLVRQAAIQAIERGGVDNPYIHYLYRRGEDVYLNLDAIPNPQQRARIAQVIHTTNNGGEVGLSMIEVIRAISQLGRRP